MSVRVLRSGAAANVLFGVLIAISAIIRLAADDAATAAVAAWPGGVGALFGIFGLAGLYLGHGDRLGRWAAVAFVSAMTGLALSVAQLYGLTFAPPGVGPLGPFFPLGYGPLLFGFLPLAVTLLRSRVLPRVALLALIAGAALNAAGFATPEVRLAGVVVFGVGIAWLGLTVSAGLLQAPAGTGSHAAPRGPGTPGPGAGARVLHGRDSRPGVRTLLP